MTPRIRNYGHAHDVAHEGSARVFVDASSVLDEIEPLVLPDDDQAARDGALRGIHWMLQLLSPNAIIARTLALRYVFRLERRPIATVAAEFGFCRAAISKHIVQLSDDLGIPALKTAQARAAYRKAQLTAWEKRPRKREEHV